MNLLHQVPNAQSVVSSKTLPEPENIQIAGKTLRVFRCNTVVVGTGAAGYNAADTLYAMGQTSVAIVTEGVHMGTSRNTGSDKQTYYKLTLAGGEPDSVEEMAHTLFEGGSMHGDIAMVEAALSARCFCKLVNIGVPFPHNAYGEYVGYKTDHDPRQRATSCGPLTSRYMTEKLEQSVLEKGIPIFDGYRVLAVLSAPVDEGGKQAIGLLALDMRAACGPELVLFNCTNIVYATGGPSALYGASVYPKSQSCATGAALEAGALGVNLTESQYGIASLQFRWNLSGTYQQVIPTYIVTEQDGSNPREFLDKYFESPTAMVDAIFLKGYQWPFDPRKLGKGGSSLVDIAVFMEIRQGRRVFLDFRRNPAQASLHGHMDWSVPGAVTSEYLHKSSATQALPVARLQAMNPLAYQLYRDNGIDLEKEMLEIAVCAQHNNGGLAVNMWWESNLKHFFPVGEVSGTFGVYRPGGSALNSTQVGSARAAMFIRHNYREAPMPNAQFAALAEQAVAETAARIQAISQPRPQAQKPLQLRRRYQQRMDLYGAFIRPYAQVCQALEECAKDLANYEAEHYAASPAELAAALVNRDILLAQYAYLASIAEYIEQGGKSRGSYLVCDSPEALDVTACAVAGLRVELDDGAFSGQVCETLLHKAQGPACSFKWSAVRPVPQERDSWFESVYNAWNKGQIIRAC